MDLIYTVIVESICCMGVITNLVLLFVVLKCPQTAMKLARFYFTFISIQNTIMVICYLFLIPRMLVRDNMYVFLAIGKGSQWLVAPELILVYNATLISTLVYSTKSFIYRYIQLCRPHLFFIYTSAKHMTILKLINVAVILNWVLMIYFTGWPSPAFVAYLRHFMMVNFDFKLANHAFVGYSIKLLPAGDFAFLVESLVLLLVLAGTAFYCALRVHLYLKSNSVSSQTKRIQRTFFIVLLVQTACPVLLLHVPLLLMFLMLFIGWDAPPVMSVCCEILMSGYPFFSATIVIIYMKDYRRLLFRLIGLEKRRMSTTTTIFVTATDGKSRFTT